MQRILYKLTTQDHKTRVGHDNETQWGKNVTRTAPGNGDLCTAAYIHAYTTPLLAVFMNLVGADIRDPVLWRCVGKAEKTDGTTVGCTVLTTIKPIALPQVTTTQRVAFGILAALKVYRVDPGFCIWAKAWLNGKDRGKKSANAAAEAAAYVADLADYAKADAAADVVADTAYAATYAADAAAYAATYAADAAADAAADVAITKVDFAKIARRALKY